MQYFMSLLIAGGVLVLMLCVALGISYGLGVLMRSRVAPAGSPDADPCAQCQADRDWYDELPVWQRSLITAWWVAHRYQCVTRGCE
jgi:hypothetical protein